MQVPAVLNNVGMLGVVGMMGLIAGSGIAMSADNWADPPHSVYGTSGVGPLVTGALGLGSGIGAIAMAARFTKVPIPPPGPAGAWTAAAFGAAALGAAGGAALGLMMSRADRHANQFPAG